MTALTSVDGTDEDEEGAACDSEELELDEFDLPRGEVDSSGVPGSALKLVDGRRDPLAPAVGVDDEGEGSHATDGTVARVADAELDEEGSVDEHDG